MRRDPSHRLSGSENTIIEMINPLQTPPHGLSGREHRIMINPLQMRWQPHLMASVGGNMPARFA